MQAKLQEFVEKTGVWPLVAGGAALAVSGFALWVGAFKKVEIKERSFPGGTFIYKNWQGHIKNITNPFFDVFGTLQRFRKENPGVAPESLPNMGIYYDPPE